jgi:hypothetical protein
MKKTVKARGRPRDRTLCKQESPVVAGDKGLHAAPKSP